MLLNPKHTEETAQLTLTEASPIAQPQPRSAALRYPGSKWSIAGEIVSHFGAHYHYVEPYFGSGAVFFTKSRRLTSFSTTPIISW